MTDKNQEILRDAIARNAGIVFSLPSAGMLRHHKSRFLCQTGDGFWVESPPSEKPLIDSLINSKQPAGVSFKNGHTKVVFGSTLVERKSEFQINATTQVEAVLMAMPAELKAIQRRNDYRVAVQPDAGLSARVWRIAGNTYLGDRPMTVQEVLCDIRDLSTGGMGVVFRGKDGEFPKVSTEDRLRIELSYQGKPLLLEGTMRHPAGPPKSECMRAGVQFKKLQSDMDGRQIIAQLTRIVGELQRDEVRRMRLGLCNAS